MIQLSVICSLGIHNWWKWLDYNMGKNCMSLLNSLQVQGEQPGTYHVMDDKF